MYTEQDIWRILETINDPEVPVLSIIDLGIIRHIVCKEDETVEIVITPTYTGCPAMDIIAMQIRMNLLQLGIKNIQIITVLTPTWTTDWMSELGKQKLKAYGIAPPRLQKTVHQHHHLFVEEAPVPCPHCNSSNTQLISQFGSTACKALHQCKDCKEPFDYFKCH